MSSQSIYIAHPTSDEQTKALKAFFNALDIRFEVRNEGNYNPAFVEKVLESKRQSDEGKSFRVPKENFKEFLGL